MNGVSPDGVEGPDADGDGLLDVWETVGIDVNDDGVIDFNPVSLGVGPQKKDLIYEVDSMTGLAPDQATYDVVLNRFQSAPVANPDGSTGVNLILLIDETTLPVRNTPDGRDPRGPLGTEFHDLRDQFYGTPADRAAANSKVLLAARALAVRYYLNGNVIDQGTGGIAELGGVNGISAVGVVDPERRVPRTLAPVMIHEIGHNIGLRHGGNVDTNNLPNYLSVMNYQYAYETTEENTGKIPNHPDFSRQGDAHFADWPNIQLRPGRNLVGVADIPPAEGTDPPPGQNSIPEPGPTLPDEEPLPDEFLLGRYAAGSDTGTAARLFEGTGKLAFTVAAYDPGVRGVRVAAADVDGDGETDLVTAPGPGGPVVVKVFSGATGKQVLAVPAFESSFTGGGFVAVEDFNGDGFFDLVVTPDEGGGPVVAIFDGAKLAAGQPAAVAQSARFFGIEDVNFRGGARVAAGDVNGDGTPDLVVAAGFGGGPRVAVFDGERLFAPASGGPLPTKLVSDFFAFEASLRNGVFVAAGDVTDDGLADLVIGAGPGGGPRVMVLDAAALAARGAASAISAPVANFFAGDQSSRAGVRVATGSLVADSPNIDLLTGAGSGVAGAVTTYAGRELVRKGNNPDRLGQFIPFDDGLGVFVG